jgi:[ribosomal protein S18]-alanine N-acetyltransferase
MISPNVPDETGGDEIQIRPMTQKDLEAVVRIERLSYSVPWSNATFRGLLFRADTDLLCAEIGGTLVGYAVCWFVLDQGELGNVAVDPVFRRRGIAARLVEATLERARKRRAKEVFLEVRRSNDVAQRLYKRLGFREVGVRRNYYSLPAEDALVMRASAGL